MIELRNQLILEAQAKYGEIFPCGIKTDLRDCFTHEEKLGTVTFWFNTAADKSTRAITIKVRR